MQGEVGGGEIGGWFSGLVIWATRFGEKERKMRQLVRKKGRRGSRGLWADFDEAGRKRKI